MLDPVEFTSGHSFVDNGVGDYNLACPHFEGHQFVPYMLALIAGPENTCPFCHAPLGERQERSNVPHR